jgi:hypothetical protein
LKPPAGGILKSFDPSTMKEPPGAYTFLKKGSFATRFPKDFAVCLSLVNILFLRLWTELLTYTSANSFQMAAPPKPADYLALIFNVLLGGSLLAAVVTFVRHQRTSWLRILTYVGFLLMLVMCGSAIRAAAAKRHTILRGDMLKYLGTGGTILMLALLAAVMILVISLWSRPLVRLAYSVLLALSPFVALTFGQALWAMSHYDPAAFRNKPLAARLPVNDGRPRVLWMVFDEFDQRLAFAERPRDLPLPELDRLRAQSVYGTNVTSPSTATRVSLPSLINGVPVVDEQWVGVDDTHITFSGSVSRRWDSSGTIFAEERALGVNTALVGWFLSYCRILNNSLNRCWWCEMENQMNSNGETLAEIMPNQARSLLETSLLSPFGQSLTLRHKVAQYQAMMQEARSVAADGSIGMSLVHWNTPHPPHMYNRRTGTFTLGNAPIAGYLDSLALVDRSLGEIRQAMEKAGLWDSTAVLVTSDHPYRYSQLLDGKRDSRIPFLMKMPFQKDAVAYEAGFNSIITKELLLSISRKEIQSAKDLTAWLDRHRQINARVP